MAGDAETGVSIMRLTAGLDAGPVCLAAPEPIRPDDDYGTLAARLQALGGRLLVQALDERPPWVEQPAEGVTYAREDRGGRPRARSHAHAGGARAHGARAAAAHRRAASAARRELSRASAARAAERIGSEAGSGSATAGAGSRDRGEHRPGSAAAAGARAAEVQPPGGRPMAAGHGCAGGPIPAVDRLSRWALDDRSGGGIDRRDGRAGSTGRGRRGSTGTRGRLRPARAARPARGAGSTGAGGRRPAAGGSTGARRRQAPPARAGSTGAGGSTRRREARSWRLTAVHVPCSPTTAVVVRGAAPVTSVSALGGRLRLLGPAGSLSGVTSARRARGLGRGRRDGSLPPPSSSAP